MLSKSIEVYIVEMTTKFLLVKLPFLDVPVKMNYEFFDDRLKAGYYIVHPLSKYKFSWM